MSVHTVAQILFIVSLQLYSTFINASRAGHAYTHVYGRQRARARAVYLAQLLFELGRVRLPLHAAVLILRNLADKVEHAALVLGRRRLGVRSLAAVQVRARANAGAV